VENGQPNNNGTVLRHLDEIPDGGVSVGFRSWETQYACFGWFMGNSHAARAPRNVHGRWTLSDVGWYETRHKWCMLATRLSQNGGDRRPNPIFFFPNPALVIL